ncbi:MAG: hypothetical protein JO293_00185 [Candidatus Eremiobacteraeota bacterium]|nr:hypothetical protein [Candidatus Eremiobacteraeota bacterium]
MTRRIAILFSLAALGALASLYGGTALAAKNPISIQQCFVQVPKPLSHNASGTTIVFTNTSSKTASTIVFQVVYRNAENKFVRRVTDSGTFQPGVQVDHSYKLFNDVTYAGKNTQACTAVSVTFSDGSKWSD